MHSVRRGRRPLIALVLLATAGVLTAHSAAGSQDRGKRLQATFTEGVEAVHDQTAAFGILQAVLTGSGNVKGFGAATEVVAVNQDRSVTPCGPGSAVDQSIRRITTADGVLVLRLSGIRCLTAGGPVVTSTYRVDGLASTGVFAGARGRGRDVAHVALGRATISGRLVLAGSSGDGDGDEDDEGD